MTAARACFFGEQLKDVPLDKVVVLDESYATTTFTPLRGRCPRHQRLHAYVPAGHWKRLTILAAVTTAGVLCAMTIDASTDTAVSPPRETAPNTALLVEYFMRGAPLRGFPPT